MASSRAGTRSVVSIPKILHAIWVGDESRRPDRWIQTWRMMHPTWAFKVWGNADYEARAWKSKRQMEIFRALKHWEGVADLMRYEILHEQGGVYVDADSACVRPLDDWLLDTRMFAIWESERHRPGLVANGFIGSIPGHPALEAIIRVTARMHKTPVSRRSWRSIRFEGVRPRFEWTYDAPSKTVGP